MQLLPSHIAPAFEAVTPDSPNDTALESVEWPLLTPADSTWLLNHGYEVTSRIQQVPQIRTSSVCPQPLVYTRLALGDFGFRPVVGTHPASLASNRVRVPWLAHFPLSFLQIPPHGGHPCSWLMW